MIIEIGDIANIIFLIATMIFIIMAIEMKNLIKASISLGIGSALLAMARVRCLILAHAAGDLGVTKRI